MQRWLEPIRNKQDTVLIPEIFNAEVTIPWINTKIFRLL